MSAAQETSQIFNDNDVRDLMSELESALGMMEPYYSQCNAGDEGYSLLARLKDRQAAMAPVVVKTISPARCKICEKTFIHNRKKKVMTAEQRNSAALSHSMQEHNITDSEERHQSIQKAVVTKVVYKNRAAFEAAEAEKTKNK